MSENNDTDLALAALERALRNRHVVPPGLVHHTDRGSPYASEDCRAALALPAGTTPSAMASSRSSGSELADDEHYRSLRRRRDLHTPRASTALSDCTRSATTPVRPKLNLEHT